MKSVSEAQIRMIAYLVNKNPVDDGVLRKALFSAQEAYKFIDRMKKAADQEKEEMPKVDYKSLPLTERRIIDEVRHGHCPDYQAVIRGKAIAELLGIQPTAAHEDLDNAYKGLYRGIIGAIIESYDIEVELMFCAACQLDLSVEAGTEACPRCGTKLIKGE